MQYLTLLTQIGAVKIAAATAANSTVQLTHIAVGDSSGTVTMPNANQTTLINEVFRASLNNLSVDENNSNWVVTEGYIGSNDGNFWIREVGIFDIDGDLIAVGNYPETFKPLMADGVAKDLYLKVIIEVSSTEAVTLQIDPSIVMASREFVTDELLKYAFINGDESKNFKVKDAQNANEAINKGQFDAELEKIGFPIGWEYTANKTTPALDELLNLGGEYLRASFPILWAYIQTEEELLLTDAQWHVENNAKGMCGYFSSGDGITTFRLKNYEGATIKAVDGVNRLVGSFQDHKAVSNYLYWHDGGSYSTPPSDVTNINHHNSGTSLGYTHQVQNVTKNPEGTTVKNIGGLPFIVAK